MKRAYIALIVIAIVVLILAPIFFFFHPESEKYTLKIYCAGSLMFPLEKAAEAFERAHPNIDVEVEGHGSIQVIRHVTELGDEVDLMMVADYSLIPVMMYNTSMPDSNSSYTDWYIRFAGNSIVLAYTNQSKYSDEVNAQNWYEILRRSDVKFGFPNPLIDALGYRSPMVIQLAEDYYKDNQIFDDLVINNFDPRFTVVDLSGQKIIIVPEALNPVGGKLLLRASSVQLLPLLESGAIDYCFLYLSNAEQYDVEYVELPDEINLGSPQQQEHYEKVQVKFIHQRFGSVGLTRDGKTIYYGLTIPKNAPTPQVAVEFVKYILAGEGNDVFASDWHPIYDPSFTDNLQALPEDLQALVEEDAEQH